MLSEKIQKILIFAGVFLFPLFFLPSFQNFIDFPKQVLLGTVVFLAFLILMLRIFSKQEDKIYFHPISLFFILFLIFNFVSLLISKSKTESFFGLPFSIPYSFLTLIFLFGFYFLVKNLLNEKEVSSLIFLFFTSILLLVIFSIFQGFGKFILPFEITKNASFNPAESPGNLAVLLSCLLPFSAILFSLEKRPLKVFYFIFIILSLIFLLMINAKSAFLILALSSVIALSLIFSERGTKEFQSATYFLGFFLVFALFFFLLNFPVLKTHFGPEVLLSQRAGFDITSKFLFEPLGIHSFFGFGPGTFPHIFSLKKPNFFNQTVFWNSRFNKSSSELLEIFTTLGIIGGIFFALFLFFVVYFYFKSKPSSLQTILFTPVLSFILVKFLYPTNFLLDFSFFLFLALFVKTLNQKEIDLNQIKKVHLLSFSLFSILCFLIISISLTYQNVISEIFYNRGVNNFYKGNLEKAISDLETVVRMNPRFDYYFRDLSQLYLARVQEKVQKNETQNIAQDVSEAIKMSKIASEEKGNVNVANWSQRGILYHSLTVLAQGADDHAITAFEEAIKRDPENPFYYNQEGILYMRKAILGQDAQNNLEKAKTLIEKAISLKPDYAPAHFQLAMYYQTKGDVDNAISKLEEIKILTPNDVGLAFQLGVLYYQKENYKKAKEELERAVLISPNYANALYFLSLSQAKLGEKDKAIENMQKVYNLNPDVKFLEKVIENLKAGKENPLEGISQEVPPQAPVQEQPPEIKK
jgi:tetratricopeptide (TPR) repeat protein